MSTILLSYDKMQPNPQPVPQTIVYAKHYSASLHTLYHHADKYSGKPTYSSTQNGVQTVL